MTDASGRCATRWGRVRTPMNAIIGYSEILQEEATDLEQESFIPDLQKIHGAGKHLLSLINGILDLSKVEAGKMTLYIFIAKPFNSVILRARVAACLEKKALRDRERQYLAEIQSGREKSDRLLLNVLPQSIADRLKRGETMIADHFECATVLFADLVGFTPLSRTMPPLALVELLNDIFTRFDELAAALGLEKIKTIGDAYIVAAGVPVPRTDHATAAATLAQRMNTALREISASRGLDLHLRTGLHSGPLAAGIIGRNKFAYDLWGDTVNIASRMESSAPLDTIHLSAATAALLDDKFLLIPRGAVAIRGIGEMETWTLQS